MDFAELTRGVLATLASAGIIALVALMMPAVRWSRQLAREVSIVNGLPKGEERTAWEERVNAHARRLRLFNEVMPLRHKITPWVPVLLFVGSVVWLILDPRQIDGVIAEGPIMIPFALMALLSTGVFVMTGVLGLTPNARSAEDLARQRGLVVDEAIPQQPPSPDVEPPPPGQ
ncbi:hypothetical protein N1031_02760 [Herbiconiux moechotypicola]|uniref:DUF106 domain-containing protein n=1 Tax=Herbiconiux moechotypicola TaxID=637393 RepID=A0ABN3DCZ8_9MICO|nr:hypothetical protein [Herbiconiux moechotypicola]MCS5728669.1 hypothetical protein [Herbiconiux moechotypicola]